MKMAFNMILFFFLETLNPFEIPNITQEREKKKTDTKRSRHFVAHHQLDGRKQFLSQTEIEFILKYSNSIDAHAMTLKKIPK